LLVGSPTPGLTVEYRLARLPGGFFLRYASAEFVTAKGDSLFTRGVNPDFAVSLPPEQAEKIEKALLAGTDVMTVWKERARRRFNESVLLGAADPEWDYLAARQAGKDDEWENPPLQDTILRAALELLEARDFLDSPKARP
jgi:hypothetical protein